MKLYDFNLLTRTEQTDILYKEGTYVGKRKRNTHTILLYQVDAFYVEVAYKKYRYTVHSINAFSSAANLDAYLVNIDVEDLVRCISSID